MDTKLITAGYAATGGSQGPRSGSSLDTSAQPDQSVRDPSVTLQKRARTKSFSLPLATALTDLRSPLEKSYRSTIYCNRSITQVDGRMVSKYCGQRWCLTCNRIRTARAVESYGETIRSWDDPHFVTLTIRNCSADDLPATFDLLLSTFTKAKRSITRTHGLPLVALRKMECTYNGTDYHPHLHIIVDGAAQAELLRSLWLKRLPGQSDTKGQDVRPCDDRGHNELFKYFTKLTTKTHGKGGRSVIGVDHLDVIFRAMKGRRVYQSVGFTLPTEIEEEIEGDVIEVAASTAHKRPDEEITWEWQQSVYDWVDMATGETLSDYEPSSAYVDFIRTISAPDESTVSPQELSGHTVDSSGSVVPTDHDRPRPTTTDRHDQLTISSLAGGSAMYLREGRFEIEGATFTVDGQDFLLRERDYPTKGKPQYYLVALPNTYVSSLWPKGDSVFSIDFAMADGREKVFEIDFRTAGYVVLTDHGFSRRSIRSAPWRQGAQRKGQN